MKTKLRKTRKAKLVYVTIVCVLIAITLLYARRPQKPTITQYSRIDHPAEILPDYTGVVIPPNIAPLNFLIQHEGTGYFVRICSEKGEPIEIFSKTPKISIPKPAWQKLLDVNRGRQLRVEIFVKSPERASSLKGKKVSGPAFRSSPVTLRVRISILSLSIERFARAMVRGGRWVSISET